MVAWWEGEREGGKKEAVAAKENKIQIMRNRLGSYDLLCYREISTIIYYSEIHRFQDLSPAFPKYFPGIEGRCLSKNAWL